MKNDWYDRYDANFGDDRLCACGHPYYRHFDTYEDMRHVGCKYCACGMWHDVNGIGNYVGIFDADVVVKVRGLELLELMNTAHSGQPRITAANMTTEHRVALQVMRRTNHLKVRVAVRRDGRSEIVPGNR